jgi:hypothetical protein
MSTMFVHIYMTSLMSCANDNAPFAQAYQIQDISQGIGGPKALAREGDYILENDRIRLAILGERPSMGPHTSGGSIIDADLQRNSPAYNEGFGNDRLAELFPTVNLNIPRVHEYTDGELDYLNDPPAAGSVVLLADGSDGGAAIICAEGPAEPFISLLGGLWLLLGGGDFRMRTDYILEPGAAAVLIRTYAIYGEDSACDADLSGAAAADSSETSIDILTLALEEGAVIGDFFLQGGSLNVFAPGIGFDEEGYIHQMSLGGVNSFQEPIPVEYLAGSGDGISYALAAVEGKIFVPLFTASQTVAIGAGLTGDGSTDRFPDGTALSYDRYFTVGQGDVGSALDNLLEVKEVPRGQVEGFIAEGGTGVALSDVHVFAYEPGAELPWSMWTSDIGDDPRPDGSFGGSLPVGEWELMTYATGRPKGERVPVTVTDGGTVRVVLESPQPGSIRYDIADETGMMMPGKVTFYRTDSDVALDPVLGDAFIGSSPARVSFAPYGHGQVVLPPGEYTAIASRGLEYEIDESVPFTVSEDSAIDLNFTLVHSVETSGWISADFHVHAIPSHDSGVTLPTRVATMVSEGVEYFSSNDHDQITDYDPVIEDMGLEPWVSATIGTEVTTIEVGHFLGFPLRHDFLADSGLALDWTALTPDEILDGIDLLGADEITEPITFVAHPRDGILGYFDEYSVNPYTGIPGAVGLDTNVFVTALNPLLSSANFSTDYDALELMGTKHLEIIRTPTQPELDAYDADPSSVDMYDIMIRTMEEQDALIDGTYTLGYGHEGQVDDWFTMLNLGYRYTALANSDTHGTTSTESGCPRNFVASLSDDPAFIDDADIAEAVRAGKVVASYGPFIRFFANGDESLGPGTDVTDTDDVELYIEVQSPSWFDVDRVEVYENGTLIEAFDIEVPNVDTVNFGQSLTVRPDKDSWYVVIATGNDDLSPVFNPVEIPALALQDVVTEVLGDLGNDTISSVLGDLVAIPRTYPIYPYGLTNPIFIDADGDGEFTAPGLPEWLVEPVDPTEAKKED